MRCFLMDDLLCSEDKTDFAGMSFEKLLGFYYLRMFYLGYEFFFPSGFLRLCFMLCGLRDRKSVV